MRSPRARIVLGLLSLGLTTGACNALFGVDDLAYERAGDGGEAAGPGGSGGSTSSSGGGQTGGGGGEACTIGKGGCPEGSKCTVVDPDSGEIGCGPAGNRGPWTKCFSDADCVNGTWCDGAVSICTPLCESAAECPEGAQCIAATDDQGNAIPGLRRCTSNCNPLDATPCDPTFGIVTCYYNLVAFDCAETLGLAEGSPCSGFTDCEPGAVCTAPVGGDTCSAWCTPVDSPCGNGFMQCLGTNPAVTWQGTTYGICN